MTKPTSREDAWDSYFLNLALQASTRSKDPATRVGAVIVGPLGNVLSTGFNGFPHLICDSPERLNDRETKLRLTVHAEMNAVLAAAKVSIALDHSTIYIAATDDTGLVWGGAPCCRCSVELIQAGIKHVVSFAPKPTEIAWKWREDQEEAQLLLAEAEVSYSWLNKDYVFTKTGLTKHKNTL